MARKRAADAIMITSITIMTTNMNITMNTSMSTLTTTNMVIPIITAACTTSSILSVII